MGKISFRWYAFWIGCIIGGFILGFVMTYISKVKSRSTPQATEEDYASQYVSPTPTLAPSTQPITILFTGDVMLGRSVNQNIIKNQNPSWPFEYVKDVMLSADITYINLENPLVSNCPTTGTGMKFCGQLDNVKGLLSAGVDVASLANNHTTNYGHEGLQETVQVLSDNGINVVGLDGPVVISRSDTKFSFVSFNDVGRLPGISQADSQNIQAQILDAKAQSDYVTATFHWGEEYQATPNTRQVSLAHEAIDYGADLIIGAHPHWVQTKEVYQGKTIYYSLGNFVFDQEWSPNTKKGLVVKATFSGSTLIGFDELPVLIQNYGQPRWQ